jgi:uncharacterized membrane protein YebE (DUF533 family)
MTDAKTRLGRDVYVALAAVGWADGKLDQDEADAIVRAALDEGLELAEIAEIEQATKQRVELSAVEQRLSKEDRLYVYGIARWITGMDGVVTEAESAALKRLGEVLKIPDRPREIVEKVVEEVAKLSGDDRPAQYDLVALRRVLTERLAAAQARRDKT